MCAFYASVVFVCHMPQVYKHQRAWFFFTFLSTHQPQILACIRDPGRAIRFLAHAKRRRFVHCSFSLQICTGDGRFCGKPTTIKLTSWVVHVCARVQWKTYSQRYVAACHPFSRLSNIGFSFRERPRLLTQYMREQGEWLRHANGYELEQYGKLREGIQKPFRMIRAMKSDFSKHTGDSECFVGS